MIVNSTICLRGQLSGRFNDRQHQNAGLCILFTIQPRDRKEMRKLPQKLRSEKHQAVSVILPVAAVQPISGGIAPGIAADDS